MKPTSFSPLASLVPLAVVVAASIGVAASACSSDDDSGTPTTSGADASAGSSGDGSGASMGVGGGVINGDGGVSLKTFAAPADPGPDGILVSASGEALAIKGFAFPPADPTNDTYMVDGWDFQLTAYITVFDHVTLWSNPDTVPTDQSQHGAVVAHADGPWVADLHKGGALAGKGGDGEQATPIVAIGKQDDGSSFDSATTYGFGFSTVAAPADYNAFNVNLTADEAADYAYMVANGYSVLYVGTATFKGTNCTQSTVATNSAGADGGAGYDFTKLPQTVNFRLGFSTPTNYVNCQNGTDLAGPGVNGEDHPRGIQVKDNASIDAQVTIHMDHPFWESFAEDSPLHWDQIAGQYVGATSTPEAHTEDLKGLSFTAFTDKTGAAIPWRSCTTAAAYPLPKGQLNFDPLSVPVDPSATDPSKALRDYYDYIRYTQATQGHLNSQGLCSIDRQYPSPGGSSGK